MAEVALLLLCITAVAVARNVWARDGLLSPQNERRTLERAYQVSFVPKIGISEARRLSERREAVFIDARFSSDFEQGSIPNAINIPINTQPDWRERQLRGVSKDELIVVFCQSASCPYAGRMTSWLIDSGYINVSIFAEGWKGWQDESAR